MIRTYIIVVALLLIMTPACANSTGRTLTNDVKKKFVAHSSLYWDNFQVCEVYSKNEDKRAFIARTLGGEYISEAKTIDWKEIFIREEGASSGLHLGVVALGYPDEKIAIKMHKFATSDNSKFFDNTIILTKYTALRRGNVVIFLYSETFLDDKLKSFFEQIDGTLNSFNN